MRTHNAYERAIVDDVFDFARRECSSHRVAISGASLGAYHAANIAFRFPDAVSHLISLSGAFEISDFFDGYHDENILGTGVWDSNPHESFRLTAILTEKGIRHWLDDRRWCGHDWNYWRDMLPLLPLNDLMPESLTRIAFSPNPCHPRNPRLTLL